MLLILSIILFSATDVFEHYGDITEIITESGATREKRNAIVGSGNHWTGGIVPYLIADTFSGKLIINY